MPSRRIQPSRAGKRQSSHGASEAAPADAGSDLAGKLVPSLAAVWAELGADTPAPLTDAATAGAPLPPFPPLLTPAPPPPPTADGSATPSAWYARSRAYWARQAPTVDGMLGGLGHLSPADVQDSHRFLDALGDAVDYSGAALDVGAGIGRVSVHVLAPRFAAVDIVEPIPAYAAVARRSVPGGKLRTAYVCGMENVRIPAAVRYAVVWVQWCAIYLTDGDLVAFLRRAAASLLPTGVVVVKDNIAADAFALDTSDNSVMRSDAYMRSLFARAGLDVVAAATQQTFDASLFRVEMYALTPQSRGAA
ncbi:hypothetical protein BU14_0262s0017 [Porphyra umbilicalis]|uniref:Alpha N-terminal protein methyltransferase 1 n=1 Tax=Porphyra umbilicalis TaxID=2786 RepID=A0A1X6P2B9_PORUM|nr:hypothetical protein BU14_0262s0017 [Porphyra umbilicalis]|eukprot:OSX74900.1 hypothetical protein BU14_0262s0017 [Porphyra umbilicalis]